MCAEKVIVNLDNVKYIEDFVNKAFEKEWNKSSKELVYTKIMDDLKSFKAEPYGMKWTDDEKSMFEKLSHIDKKKYLINKMGFKGGVMFPHLTPENLYKYPPLENEKSSIQKNYKKGIETLENTTKNRNFKYLDKKEKKDTLKYLYKAAKKGHLLSCLTIADTLSSQYEFSSGINPEKELQDIVKYYDKLIEAGSPDGYYGYYRIYFYVFDEMKFSTYFKENKAKKLGLNEEKATECFNKALELGHKQALEDLAYTFEHEYLGIEAALDISLTIGYLYQDSKAFRKAAEYADYYVNVKTYEIFSNACNKMANMLNSKVSEESKKYLIDGVKPYIYEDSEESYILDFGTQFYGDMYGGSQKYPGVSKWIHDKKMKDPRDKDSTVASVKDFYKKLWQIIIWKYNYRISFNKEIQKSYFDLYDYISHLLYRKYPSGFALSRPYVFPKEVLDMKIDFNKIPPEKLV